MITRLLAPKRAVAISSCHRLQSATSKGELKLVVYDIRFDPEDKGSWSGTPAHIIHGLRAAGHEVISIRAGLHRLRLMVELLLWHCYNSLLKRHYVADRHVLLNRVLTKFAEWKINRVPEVDAIIVTSITSAAYLQTSRPIFLLHDATWGQIVEMYPSYSRTILPDHIFTGGFKLDVLALGRPNVYLIMTSQWAADRVFKDFSVSPKRMHVLPFGANLVKEPSREEIEAAITGRAGQHCNLLFVGADFNRKGGLIAVEVANILISSGVPTTLHVVGSHPAGMPEFVEVHGFLDKNSEEDQTKLHSLFKQSDFFLLPTRAEAQGIVFNEAAAYGLPAIATNVGGVSAVVKEDWGLLARLQDPPSVYATWISELFRDRLSYVRMSRRAREHYELYLSADRYTAELLQIIRKVLSERIGP